MNFDYTGWNSYINKTQYQIHKNRFEISLRKDSFMLLRLHFLNIMF
jgi:hypothetical protein